MSQVQINPNELDDNFRIEQAILELLHAGDTAEIHVATVEKAYTIETDKGEDDSDATVEKKCMTLCDMVGEQLGKPVEYRTFGQESLQFSLRKPR
jgi:hypothetical protein